MTQTQNQVAVRIKRIRKYLNDKATFRNNLVTNKLEYKSQKMSAFKEVDDYALNSMSVELAEINIKCSPSELKDILTSKVSPRYNPLTEFLETLPSWDGETDYINELSSTVKTTEPELWSKAFKKWIVALVGSMKEDKIINHTFLVLTGNQGLYKSTWLNSLVPSQLNKYRYAGTIRVTDKDTLILLSEKVLIIVDELAYLNGRQLNELKEIITKNDVQLRRPYGRFTEMMPRRASFAGSANDMELLTDTTGSRRFLCFSVVSQIDTNHKIDLSGVYAQALALFNNGFKYWFDLKEIEEINKNNEQYRVKSAEEEYLLLSFEPASKGQICQQLTTSEILTILNQVYRLPISNAAKQRLGKALKANNFHSIKNRGRQVYMVRARDPEKEGYLSQIAESDNKLDM